MPSQTELVKQVALFKKSLQLTAQQIRELEINTRDQTKSQLWYSARRYQMTALVEYFKCYQQLLQIP